MALISIPTSIGGVSIPGAITGPLSKLFGSPFAIDTLSYPRDLGSSTRPHYIQFKINEIKGSEYYTSNSSELNLAGIIPASNDPGTLGSVLASGLSASNIYLSPTKKKLQGSISLFMPDTVNMQYQAGYQEDNLADYTVSRYAELASDWMKSIEGKTPSISNFINSLTSSPAVLTAIKPLVDKAVPVDIALKGMGYAINPQVQLIFKAVGLREFQMEFLMSPYSQEESVAIQNIIRTFKYHAAPQIGTGANSTGLFFVMPSTFDIEYMFQGAQNKNVHKITECVLENIAVDYAPSGWVTFPDGSPIQYRLTLQFKELQIIDKDMVLKGY